MSTVTWS